LQQISDRTTGPWPLRGLPATVTGRCCRSPRNWPGHYPTARPTRWARPAPIPTHPASDPTPKHSLHRAASSDDVGAIDALVAAGANIEAPGAVTGGRTPIVDATAFGQWDATRRL